MTPLSSTFRIVPHGVFLQMFHGVLKGSSCIESLGGIVKRTFLKAKMDLPVDRRTDIAPPKD
jgi:hypothetical protein